MISIRLENNIKKFNYYVEQIFNIENNHNLDLSTDSFIQDIFFIYYDNKLAGGFRMIYGDNQLPVDTLPVMLTENYNSMTTIEPGRLFIFKEFRKYHLYKHVLNFIDYYVLMHKSKYSTIILDSLLTVEKLYTPNGYHRASAPFYDASVSGIQDNHGNNSVLLYKNVEDIVLSKIYLFSESDSMPHCTANFRLLSRDNRY